MIWKMTLAMVFGALVILGAGWTFAPLSYGGSSSQLTAHEHHEENAATAGTGVCPVSNEKIDAKTKITYEYKGKAYSFCCPDCAEEFKKNPEKYIDKMKKQNGEKS
jgi:YHS domain-containing protein